MLGFGLSNGISQIPAKNIGSEGTIFFRNVFMSVFLLIILSFFISETNFSRTYILIAFFISFIAYIPLLTFYKALKLGKVGIIAPISNSSVILTILLSIIFFKESFGWMQLFSIILIISGILMISINFNDFKNSHLFNISSGVPFALISFVLWGFSFFLFKIPVTVLGPILTSFIIEFGILIFSIINIKVSKNYLKFPHINMLIYIFFVAFFGTIGILFYNLGIKILDVSIISVLSFANPLVSTLYGKFVYNEKLSMLQYIAILLILIGIIFIFYF